MELNSLFSLALVAILLPTTSARAQVHTHLAGGPRGGGPANDEACDVAVDTLAIGASVYWSGNVDGATGNDVWQAFTISECADVTLAFCGSVFNFPWPSYTVYPILMHGTCDSLVQTSQLHIYSQCSDANMLYTYHGLAPGSYYVRITHYSWNAATVGDYTLHATASACMPPPAEEPCDVSVDTLATGGSVHWNGSFLGTTGGGVWQAFTIAECADVTLAYCGSTPYGWKQSPVHGILMSGTCDSLSIPYTAGSIDYCSFDGYNYIWTYYGLDPGTYYLRITGISFPGSAYSIHASTVDCLPALPNDHCADVEAQSLAVGSTLTFTGEATSATAYGDYDPSFPGNQSSNTVWQAFTTAECADITVSYCGMDYLSPTLYWGTTFWNFLSNACPADSTAIWGYKIPSSCTLTNAAIKYWGLPAGTYYLPVRGIAFPYTVDVQATACGPYCGAWSAHPGGSSSFNRWISQVSFAGIDHASPPSSGYEDFLGDTAYVQRGNSYPITVNLNSVASAGTDYQLLAWIDLNGDHVFQANEQVFSTALGTALGTEPIQDTITIPADAALGNTRLRLRLHRHSLPVGANEGPCGNAHYGQVEDYTVLIEEGTGIKETGQGSFTMMPNPATEQVTITFSPSARPQQVAIYDATGRMVLERSLIGGGRSALLDLGAMKRGLYVVKVRFADGLQTVQRVVKE